MWGESPRLKEIIPRAWRRISMISSGIYYGMQIKVELLDFVRPEKQFDSIEDLKRQLDHDVAVGKERYLALAAGLPEKIGRGKL